MTTLKETAEKVLNTIHNDNRVNTKEYTEIDALKELQNAIEYLLRKSNNEVDPMDILEVGMTDLETGIL